MAVDSFNPCLASEQRSDCSATYTMFLAQPKGRRPCCMVGANASCLFKSQFGAALPLMPSLSPLTVTVLHVVVSGTKEQMLRVYTQRVVATMEDTKPFWDRTIVKFPREAVRTERPSFYDLSGRATNIQYH